ncbi:MAG: glycine cleavage system aminomethyltransferase GcvT [Chlamydiota bacterium]|nr:glycine cleavage system aminomethyltransferase GcvT [Chlamydiota bacterium]
METKMKTPLYEKHKALNARIVDFSGWEMPVQYAGILQEHQAVRNHIGIFDVSHMGRVCVEGPQAEIFLDSLSTNKIMEKKDGTATYTVLTNNFGGCIDDVIIYRENANRFFIIVNAGNRFKDYEHLTLHATNFDVTLSNRYDDEGIIAVQGPKALTLIHQLMPDTVDLKAFRFMTSTFNNTPLIVSRTGYTGEAGVELYAPNDILTELWDTLLDKGKDLGIQPVGLGARDTLRLEMGYALYGHELTDTIAPTESVSAWTVKMNKEDFIGKDALLELENSPKKRHAYGAILLDKGIAREGYIVKQDHKQIGYVTSGTHSPSLGKSIAILLVEHSLSEGDEVTIMIRNKPCQAKITKLPFYTPGKSEK